MVEFFAVGVALREEGLDVGVEAGGVEVARVAGETGFGRGVRFEEGVGGGGEAGGGGGGYDDVGAVFEAGFGDAVAYAAGATDDEDAGGGEFEGVFGCVGVGHCGGGGGSLLVFQL